MPKKTRIKKDVPKKPVEEKMDDIVEEIVEKVEPKKKEPVKEEPKVEAPKAVVPKQQPIRLYKALSNLSDNGKRIAAAGQEIVLRDSLAAYYNKHAPGSIEEVK